MFSPLPDQGVPPETLPVQWVEHQPTFWELMYWGMSGWRGTIYFAFLIWMVVYCLRRDPERYLWLWVMLLFQPLGAVIYFFARYLPSTDIGELKFMKRWRKTAELERLRIAAGQIGNAHQHLQYGDAARELGRHDTALSAYQAALAKEPDNLAALWGAANVDYIHKDFAAAHAKLKAVLDKDPSYKFGDVSLLYGKTLAALDDTDAAITHLEQHIRRWRQPEALYLLAVLCLEHHRPDVAQTCLQGLIDDVNAGPRSIARKHLFWKSRAKRLLKKAQRGRGE